MARPKKRAPAALPSPSAPLPHVAPALPSPVGVDAATLMMVATLQQQVVQLDARVRALEAERMGPRPAPPQAAPAGIDTSGMAPLEAHRAKERAAILAALEDTRWNRKEVAERLGLPRRTLYRRMAEYGLQEGDTRTGFAKRQAAPKKKG